MDEGENLPFRIGHRRKIQSSGTNVYLPDSGGNNNSVIKVSKKEFPVNKSREGSVFEEAKTLRRKEEIAFETAGRESKERIIPQEYVITEGTQPGKGRIARVQPFVEGYPLKEIGFRGIMRLGYDDRIALKEILKDSMKCFLRQGTNFDLFGSSENGLEKTSRLEVLKRCIFPLRNSNNLFLTPEGIKLIDPNVLGTPGKWRGFKPLVIGSLLFLSSAANYCILKAGEILSWGKSGKKNFSQERES